MGTFRKPRRSSVAAIALAQLAVMVAAVTGSPSLDVTRPQPAAAAVVQKSVSVDEAPQNPEVLAEGDITAAAFGEFQNYNDVTGGAQSHGDTFYNAWLANDAFYMNHDDGYGFAHPSYVNTRVTQLNGNPNSSTAEVQGTNINPGSLGSAIPQTYSTGLYEVDGVLYRGAHYSCAPEPTNCGYDVMTFRNTSLIKSSDGGANWRNPAGQLNTVPPNDLAQSTFRDPRWGFPSFINYGKGGITPAIDNAQNYVYLVTGDSSALGEDNPLNGLFGDTVFLARIARSALPNLNHADVEYYRGTGDGMLASSWSSSPSNMGAVLQDNSEIHAPQINYDAALGRYVMSTNGAFFPNNSATNQKWRLNVYTATKPWGPWTKLYGHGAPYIIGGVLANNKWTTTDGKKMWWLSTGGYNSDYFPYGVIQHPVYLSTGTVDTYQAEAANLSGTTSANSYAGYSGTGYATGFDNVNDSVTFTVNNIQDQGWHILNFRYSSTNSSGNTVSVVVNGRKARTLNLSRNDNTYHADHNWTENSQIYYLNAGSNTVTIKQDTGDTGSGLHLDSLKASRESTHNEGKNIAYSATASASSSYAGYSPSAINDGSYASPAAANEWASNNEWTGAWAQLYWNNAVTINKIKLYDRPIPGNQVLSGTLTFSDGSTVPVGRLQNDGRAGTMVTFPSKTITWARFTITGAAQAQSNGLAEFEAYGTDPGPPSSYTVKVNAGGPAADGLSADQPFTTGSWGHDGGATHSTTATILNDQGLPNAMKTLRYGPDLHYKFTVPTGIYTATLYFSDPTSTAAGTRVADISVNGVPKLDNYDVYTQAGGKDRGVKVVLSGLTPSSGLIDIRFQSSGIGSDVNQIINAIELTNTAPSYAMRVNTGGAFADGFFADQPFSAGGWGYDTGAVHSTTATIVNNQGLPTAMQTLRYGPDLHYKFAAPAGTYTATLYFSDPTSTAAGTRVADISVNGVPKLDNYDVYTQAGGKDRGVKVVLPGLTPSSGLIDIRFQSSGIGSDVNQIINAIELTN